jgi:hypothetical protein
MEKITTTWTGIRPLIMSNPQTVQVSNAYAMKSRELGAAMKAARKKGDEDKMVSLEKQQIRNDWEASAYWDDAEKKFFIPDSLLLACIRNGAAASKKGKDIDRAVLTSETQAYVETTKHKTLQAAFEDETFRLECPCKIPPKTGALIWKARAVMPTGWKLTFDIEYDDGIVERKSLERALQAAGVVGIGGWRPKFGRFTVEVS